MGSVAHADILKELRVWSRLRHPNIVAFIGACVSSESPSLICEYMQGGSLEDVSIQQRFPPGVEGLGVTLGFPLGLFLVWGACR